MQNFPEIGAPQFIQNLGTVKEGSASVFTSDEADEVNSASIGASGEEDSDDSAWGRISDTEDSVALV